MASHEEATHGHEHTGAHDTAPKSKTASRSALWFTILLVGLFIAALNFIDVMGHSEHEAEVPATKEASSNGTLEGETGAGRSVQDTTQYHSPVTAPDSAHRENEH